MQTTATLRLSQSKKPLLSQLDLRCIHGAAARIRELSGAAARLGRDLTPGERQLLAACDLIVEIVVGQLGEDADGLPVGDLTVRATPYAPDAYQPKLRGNGH